MLRVFLLSMSFLLLGCARSAGHCHFIIEIEDFFTMRVKRTSENAVYIEHVSWDEFLAVKRRLQEYGFNSWISQNSSEGMILKADRKLLFCGEKDLAIEFLVPQQGREVRQWVVLYVKERNTLICALASDFGG